MELVRMTVLVVDGSTAVAFGNGGHGTGLLRLEGATGPRCRQRARKVAVQVLMRLSIVSFLEAVGAIDRDAILPVIAQRLI